VNTTFLWSKRSGASTLKILRTCRESRFLSKISLSKNNNENKVKIKRRKKISTSINKKYDDKRMENNYK
jgi:hypothetical protein